MGYSEDILCKYFPDYRPVSISQYPRIDTTDEMRERRMQQGFMSGIGRSIRSSQKADSLKDFHIITPRDKELEEQRKEEEQRRWIEEVYVPYLESKNGKKKGF